MLLPIVLCIVAGLMTSVGGVLGTLLPREKSHVIERTLAIGLGFSAGVMVYISLVELLPQSQHELTQAFPETGMWYSLIAFFGGIIVCAGIDWLVPKFMNPHEPGDLSEERGQKLMKIGMVSAIAIGVHNLPEGVATLMAATEGGAKGFGVVFAVAIHNLPEGLAVALPIFYATQSRLKAIGWATVSGVLEPVGAILCLLIFGASISAVSLGVVFAAIAGIMIFISIDELLPSAREFAEHHYSIYGFLAGMFVMAMSLNLF